LHDFPDKITNIPKTVFWTIEQRGLMYFGHGYKKNGVSTNTQK